jgi:P-type Ca2+ transporter type 2C
VTTSVDATAAPAWHALDVSTVEERLRTGPDGLASDEATSRLAAAGPNELEEELPPRALATFVAQFRSPLIAILIGAAIVTAALGEWVDSAAIALILLINAVIGFSQERQAEASVRGLRQLVALRARVIRDGRERQLPSREVVPGDVVLLETGVRVPADIRLSHVVGLQADESLLTGESVPSPKRTRPVGDHATPADRSCIAHAGSIVTTGRGHGYVIATGMHTELGTIAGRIRTEAAPLSPLQLRMQHLGRVIGVVIGAAAIATFAIGVAVGEPVADMFRFAVAMAVGAVPEGLPIVVTITLAIGVRRMAGRRAIVRRLAAVETLGSTTVIGSDKTGTLTENRMTVEAIWAADRHWPIDDPDTLRAAADPRHPVARALRCGVLANEAQLYLEADELRTEGDPTEAALLVAATRLGLEPEAARNRHDPVADIPFEAERRYSASVRAADDGKLLVLKGAPERVIELCDTILGPDGAAPIDANVIHAAARGLAAQGLRVLAMAERSVDTDGDVTDPTGLVEARGMTFLGMQGMLDPPRAGVIDAVAGCRAAGIRPVMITGDHAITAQAIAIRIGITDEDSAVLTGSALDGMDDQQLRDRVGDVSVYARVSPDHKLRIVEALRDRGEVVAVTGDGVNDAPALKAADIGIAMGKGGTDVARDASDLVLADDNFASIYAAVREGRATFDNVRKATYFLLSTAAAEILALVVALSLRWPLLLVPTQILWLNLVTNGLQDVALGFEPAEPGILDRPPRPRREGVMSSLLWKRTLLISAVMAAGMLLMFRWELDHTGSVEEARTVALTTMVFFQTFHLGNVRSERRSAFRISPLSNRFLLVTAAGALAVHTVALYLPITQYVLHVEPIGLDAWARAAVVGASIIAVGEADKLIEARWRRRRSQSSAPSEP